MRRQATVGRAALAGAAVTAMTPDITGKAFKAPEPQRDFTRRVVMIPMRDGVKLHTVIVIPKGARDAPILLTRTPYNAAKRAERVSNATWQPQALDKLLAKLPAITVPTMWEQGLWDQEDIYGGHTAWAALEPKDADNTRNFLVMGPWRHSQANDDGSSLGDLRFDGDTALQWRRDVLTYTSAPLAAPLSLAGIPVAHLFASTSGSDSDWVVKLIDVYPDQYPDDPKMAGYQLPIALTIFRGRYREGFDKPQALQADAPLAYTFDLPNVNHVLKPGHRLMVQVQSSLFPLYDRNPQTFVDNIFFARPGDYRKATQRIWATPQQASHIRLPVVAGTLP